MKAYFTSNSDEWETPQSLFDELDKEFHFDLDPCATTSTAKCEKYYTADDNGLAHSWGGTECSVIRRIARYPSGLRSVIGKGLKTTLSW